MNDVAGNFALGEIVKHSFKVKYIGRADDIRKRLLEHLSEDDPCLRSHRPTHFVASVVHDNVRYEKELILEYDPECNKRVG